MAFVKYITHQGLPFVFPVWQSIGAPAAQTSLLALRLHRTTLPRLLVLCTYESFALPPILRWQRMGGKG